MAKMNCKLVSCLAAGVLVIAAARPVLADAKQECSAAYQQTQAARNEGRLRDARDKAIVCSQAACPGFIKGDCARWLGEIETSLPTVVFAAHDPSNQELVDVRVFLDGAPFKDGLDGKAVAVDPGAHVFRYEYEGLAPIEERVTIREGEKNRKLLMSFTTVAQTSEPVTPAKPPPTPEHSSNAKRVAAFTLGGVGVVGVGLFGVFAGLGMSERADLQGSCAPTCTDDQIAGAKTKLLVGDISLGVGVVSLGVATYLFLTSPSKPSASTETARVWFDVAPAPGGGQATFRGSF